MSLRIHKLDDSGGEPSREWLNEACEVLSAGELVALPTETVYGLAARADHPEALAKLAQIKRRPSEYAWTWHIGNTEDLSAFPNLQATARRLADKYWPGPLTLILPGVPSGLEEASHEGWTGVRFTSEPFARALCTHAGFPVVMTSANLHGERAAVNAGELERLDTNLLGLVIDGGETRLGEASTILRIGRGKFEMLREGLHDIEALRRTAGLRLGFACTGNTCRSPMAEGLARAAIAARLECQPENIADFGFEVRSMGVFASSGSPASHHAVNALKARGIDIAQHGSSPAMPEVIAQLDELYCMTHAHRSALGMILPPGKDGHVRLLDPEERDVPDPIGGTAADYQRCAQHIAESIDQHLPRWV